MTAERIQIKTFHNDGQTIDGFTHICRSKCQVHIQVRRLQKHYSPLNTSRMRPSVAGLNPSKTSIVNRSSTTTRTGAASGVRKVSAGSCTNLTGGSDFFNRRFQYVNDFGFNPCCLHMPPVSVRFAPSHSGVSAISLVCFCDALIVHFPA